MYAPRHQVKFLARVNPPGDKPDSDSDVTETRELSDWTQIKLQKYLMAFPFFVNLFLF